MKITVRKWGNSFGIRIPATYAQMMDLNDGSIVELSRIENGIKIIPRNQSRREQLESLLSQITPENMHHGEFFGMEVGEEKW